ncbi:ParB/RepB/Spo0J family partition protein [Streptomyces sp. H27-D2]|uniref:ParB/RepB/Spo0J family partition protein n=1 Tax=Streptomyces sp. H27-D2 TaxID=3046304 RepID=UPI002DC0642C|nr:ParB/RepB/Spo0J family partition protein [Streptomyces sp. H27-D2]MEC4019815.1 ParB/RepB/Spo0J family partition protein [Streptomyces sp. H27-D2]
MNWGITYGEEEINQQPVVEVELSSLSLVGSPRLSGERTEHVQMLAAAQTRLPPITVHRATMRVIDGFHRLKAARLRGEGTIAVRFFDGDEAEAFVLAVKLNVTHGLPLALADRKRASERIIASHPQWSDRRVAAVTGISPGTVGDIRKRIVRGPEPETGRVGQDGRLRPLDGSMGRMLAGELLSERPDLSLRQVARVARISPETVRDVRNRLRNGEDLLPNQRKKKPTVAGVAGGGTAGGGDAVVRRKEFGGLGRAQPSGRPRGGPPPDHAALIKRLKADPALRFTETGRNLLRLLALHTLRKEEWDAIINNVPPHCSDIVADLARQFADIWSEFAVRVKEDMAQIS